VLEAVELPEMTWKFWQPQKTIRFIKVRNPWGRLVGEIGGVWKGPWSDGSREWTPGRMIALKRKSEVDGTFIMTF